MIIVAKALQDSNIKNPDYEDIDLPRLRKILALKGFIAYAWTFNPQQWAREELRKVIETNGYVWLYLIGDRKWYSTKKLKVVDFYPDVISNVDVACPVDWKRYSPKEHINGRFNNWKDTGNSKSIRIWFLIREIRQCNEDLSDYPAYFHRRKHPYYREYKQNNFAFLDEKV